MLPGELESIDLNVVESVRHFARWQDGSLLVEEDGILLASGASDFPVGPLNCALRVDTGVPPELVLERADEFFGDQGRGYTLWVRDHADRDLEEAILARGLSRITESPWMVLRRRLDESLRDANPDCELRVAQGEQEVRDAHAVNREAYQALAYPPEAVDAIYGRPQRVLQPNSVVVVGYVSGRPVATAMALITAGVAGVYWVGTLESQRGRGLGGACTRRVGNEGLARGASLVALQASPLGEPLYRRLGYETISAHRWYLSPSTPSGQRPDGPLAG